MAKQGPKEKFFGSLNLDGIGKAVKSAPDKVKESDFGRELKIQAAQWDDDGISISVYNAETKENIKIGNLKVSQFTNKATDSLKESIKPSDVEGDLPF